jgi:hypothetical protein
MSQALRVNVVCRNMGEDRIIPRMARALSKRLGWTLTAAPDLTADVIHLSGYFEAQKFGRWPDMPVAAYFSHREEEPPRNAKQRLYDQTARQVQLRIATCKLYADPLRAIGPTIQAAAPLERDRFIMAARGARGRPVVGFSGYTYANKRKGEDLVRGIVQSGIARRVEWRASGRGWPVPTRQYTWAQMPEFYQGLDVLVCPSRVEGIPMPPLEALACGVRIVIPRQVGLLDELADIPGIYRYERGDLKSLLQALERAAFPEEPVECEALRAATQPYSVEAWCNDHAAAFAERFGCKTAALQSDHAGISQEQEPRVVRVKVQAQKPVNKRTGSKRGIYCVAFGEPARHCAQRLMASIKRYMPDIPVAFCGAKRLGGEDVFIRQPDSDVGGRRAKLRAYELAPAEWESVLYLDADTEVVAPIYKFFEWIESGWEFVICKDPHLMDTMHAYKRRDNAAEMAKVEQAVKTLNCLQYNGGVWAFARVPRVEAFFLRWREGWEEYAQRDQGALLKAMYAAPLRVLVLGNEWNTFPKYSRGVKTAGLMHYPGDARRWKGMLPGRIDSPEAWKIVKRYEKALGGKQ